MSLNALVATLLALAAIALPDPVVASPAAPGLVVIGATAKSSTAIIRQALAAGYTVTGVARRPEDVALKDRHLKVLKGDVYDLASLEAAMTGTEVVVVGAKARGHDGFADRRMGLVGRMIAARR